MEAIRTAISIGTIFGVGVITSSVFATYLSIKNNFNSLSSKEVVMFLGTGAVASGITSIFASQIPDMIVSVLPKIHP